MSILFNRQPVLRLLSVLCYNCGRQNDFHGKLTNENDIYVPRKPFVSKVRNQQCNKDGFLFCLTTVDLVFLIPEFDTKIGLNFF